MGSQSSWLVRHYPGERMTSQKLVKYVRKPKKPATVAEIADKMRGIGPLPSVLATTEPNIRIHANPALAYIEGLRPGPSQRTMRTQLKAIAEFFSSDSFETFPWWTLTNTDVSALVGSLKRLKPETANLRIYALRGVLKKCALIVDEQGVPLLTFDALMRVRPEAIKGSSVRKGRALSEEEIQDLFAVCAKSQFAVRDKAMLALLYGCGLRRSELATASFVGYRDGQLRVLRKGGYEEDVPVPPGAREHVEAWIKSRGTEEGPLLWMSASSIYERLKMLVKLAGGEKAAPHDLRRTYITKLIDDGEDLFTVARLAGHKDIQTTMKYDKRGDRAKKAAAERFKVPK